MCTAAGESLEVPPIIIIWRCPGKRIESWISASTSARFCSTAQPVALFCMYLIVVFVMINLTVCKKSKAESDEKKSHHHHDRMR